MWYLKWFYASHDEPWALSRALSSIWDWNFCENSYWLKVCYFRKKISILDADRALNALLEEEQKQHNTSIFTFCQVLNDKKHNVIHLGKLNSSISNIGSILYNTCSNTNLHLSTAALIKSSCVCTKLHSVTILFFISSKLSQGLVKKYSLNIPIGKNHTGLSGENEVAIQDHYLVK